MAERYILGDAGIMDSAHGATLTKEEERWEVRQPTDRNQNTDRGRKEKPQLPWGMLFDIRSRPAGMVATSGATRRPQNGMAAIMTPCVAYGLAVSEAKTEMTCLRTEGGVVGGAVGSLSLQPARYL